MREETRNGAGELPGWEQDLLEDAVTNTPETDEEEHQRARRRALQLAREQAYFRLALEIDRPRQTKVSPSQLSFFPTDPTLFDDAEQ
jgi:hypothetical protein